MSLRNRSITSDTNVSPDISADEAEKNLAASTLPDSIKQVMNTPKGLIVISTNLITINELLACIPPESSIQLTEKITLVAAILKIFLENDQWMNELQTNDITLWELLNVSVTENIDQQRFATPSTKPFRNHRIRILLTQYREIFLSDIAIEIYQKFIPLKLVLGSIAQDYKSFHSGDTIEYTNARDFFTVLLSEEGKIACEKGYINSFVIPQDFTKNIVNNLKFLISSEGLKAFEKGYLVPVHYKNQVARLKSVQITLLQAIFLPDVNLLKFFFSDVGRDALEKGIITLIDFYHYPLTWFETVTCAVILTAINDEILDAVPMHKLEDSVIKLLLSNGAISRLSKMDVSLLEIASYKADMMKVLLSPDGLAALEDQFIQLRKIDVENSDAAQLALIISPAGRYAIKNNLLTRSTAFQLKSEELQVLLSPRGLFAIIDAKMNITAFERRYAEHYYVGYLEGMFAPTAALLAHAEQVEIYPSRVGYVDLHANELFENLFLDFSDFDIAEREKTLFKLLNAEIYHLFLNLSPKDDFAKTLSSITLNLANFTEFYKMRFPNKILESFELKLMKIVEVGYRTFKTEVDIRPNKTFTANDLHNIASAQKCLIDTLEKFLQNNPDVNQLEKAHAIICGNMGLLSIPTSGRGSLAIFGKSTDSFNLKKAKKLIETKMAQQPTVGATSSGRLGRVQRNST